MNSSNIWNFITTLFSFIFEVFEAFEELWNYSITLPGLGENGTDLTFTFPQMLTVALGILILALLIKKFIPVA